MKYSICKIAKLMFAVFFLCFVSTTESFSQRVGFISSDQIRELFPEAKQADQRLETIVDEWKREIKELDQLIEAKAFEIQKNRLVWTEAEKSQNNSEYEDLKTQKMEFAKAKYSVGGEYDQIVKAISKPVEDKIFGAVQKVSAEEGYDIIWDKSSQPLPYVNFKYDLTLKVLKELGVDTKQLEQDLDKKIKTDPRNIIEAKSQDTPTKKTRKRRTELNKEDEDKTNSTETKVEEKKNNEELKIEQEKKEKE